MHDGANGVEKSAKDVDFTRKPKKKFKKKH